MRQPDIRKFLFDIQNVCTLIPQFVAGKSFDDYRSVAPNASSSGAGLTRVSQALVHMALA